MALKRPEGMSDEEFLAYANEKARKKKEARDKMLANKTNEKGLVIIHTGKGKGKSTAAFGIIFRALGNGMRVGVVQFVKGKWETGERVVLEKFPDLVEIKSMGEGFTWETQDRARDISAAEGAWAYCKDMIERSRVRHEKRANGESLEGDDGFDVLLFDEINIVLRYDYLDMAEVLDVLENKPDMLHVILTGRNAKEELIEDADLVTEMTQVKHPFREQNIKAQVGIEF